MTTYREIFKYKPLQLNAAHINKYMETFPIPLSHAVVDKSCLVGIEVEVENCPTSLYFDWFWQKTEDGSLRNYGIEFISSPLRGEQVEYAVRLLFSALKDSNPGYEFTPRCSIHVHMNARTMNKEQLSNMMLLYVVFEKMLFNFVGHDRDKNIHCVPLYDTNLVGMLNDVVLLNTPTKSWMKYTAVNLLPLPSKGTVEFRHLHGTDDVDKIMTWINLLLKLKLAAYKNDVVSLQNEVFLLNSNSQYREFAYRVFGEYSKALFNDDVNFAELMEDGVTLAKTVFSGNEFKQSLKVPADSRLGKMFNVKQDKSFSDFVQEYLINQSNTTPSYYHVNLPQIHSPTVWIDELPQQQQVEF